MSGWVVLALLFGVGPSPEGGAELGVGLGARSSSRPDGKAKGSARFAQLSGRQSALHEVEGLGWAERLERLSEGFLNMPYRFSPLGEGEGPDPDPRIRYDAADCLTYVEQLIAMARSTREEDIEPLLQHLRYAGEAVRYDERNHLMEAQWLPNNLRKGYLRDITREVGGTDAVLAEKVLDARSWQSKTSRALGLSSEHQPTGTFAVPMIPIDKLKKLEARIPSGVILVVLRDDRPLLPTRISHLGFLVRRKQKLHLRHASRTFGRVVDEDLDAFVRRNLGYAKWTVAGVALYAIADPAGGLSPAPAPSQP